MKLNEWLIYNYVFIYFYMQLKIYIYLKIKKMILNILKYKIKLFRI